MSMTSKEVADKIDFYGAVLITESTPDYSSIKLMCLSKHLDNLLPILKEILTAPTFPKKELQIFIQNSIDRLSVDNEKNNFVARKQFSEMLFGEDHPYGYYSGEEDYNRIEQSDLVKFHSIYYHSNNCQLILSGKINETVRDLLEKYLGTKDWSLEDGRQERRYEVDSSEQRTRIRKNDTLQSAIRIGKILFNKTHPDHGGMMVLNTVLGGYFGSRLMKNLREDKGFTYGIGSRIVSFFNNGEFYIGTEVNAKIRAGRLMKYIPS